AGHRRLGGARSGTASRAPRPARRASRRHALPRQVACRAPSRREPAASPSSPSRHRSSASRTCRPLSRRAAGAWYDARTSMDIFLGKESCPGPCVCAGTASGSYAGQAHFNGCIAFSNWQKEEVAAVLPDELELAVNTSAAAELHPVVFIFGEQTEGATIFGGVTFPMRVNYHELAFAIPFVKNRRGTHLHPFVPRVVSVFFPARWAGNGNYGLGKGMGTMRWEGPRFAVAMADGTMVFHASIEPVGGWEAGPRCDLPNFAGMRDVFALPVVGRRTDGTYVTS